jgi:hypothetical protein
MSSQFGEAIAKTMIVPKMIASGQPIPPQWSSFAPSTPTSPYLPPRGLGPSPVLGPGGGGGVSPNRPVWMGASNQQRQTIMGQNVDQPFTQTKLGRANIGAQ